MIAKIAKIANVADNDTLKEKYKNEFLLKEKTFLFYVNLFEIISITVFNRYFMLIKANGFS